MTVSNSVFSEEMLQQFIEKQLQHNSRKNVFYSGEENKLAFLNETCDLIEKLKKNPIFGKEKIIDFTVDKALTEFYKINQYYRFNEFAKDKLKQIYRQLFTEILHPNEQKTIAIVAENHYARLQEWLAQSNPFASKIYPENLSVIEEVVCAEYSAELQMEILGLDISTLQGPVLDIGCGNKAHLVKVLAASGFEVYGIDRNISSADNLEKADWLDYHFIPNHWGTIVSNLGFSNHFRHHHLRNDGDFIIYAQKYMEILQSLKPGGAFYYAPDLPFIEGYLDSDKYEVTKNDIPLSNYQSVRIKKKNSANF